jgi:hypothetical protein
LQNTQIVSDDEQGNAPEFNNAWNDTNYKM